MDFQRLFKRKEEGPLPVARDNTREILNERDVLVREGELFDGQSPASVVWSKVGGAISVKADKILGILEGRTRIKAAVLQELYPGLFEKPPNPGTEFTIPLQAVVTQLQDVFAGVFPEEADLEDFDTPFGQLAREDEARFKDGRADRPGKIRSYETTAIPTTFDKPIGEVGLPTARNGTQSDLESQVVREEPPKPVIEELFPVLESGHPDSAGAVLLRWRSKYSERQGASPRLCAPSGALSYRRTARRFQGRIADLATSWSRGSGHYAVRRRCARRRVKRRTQ